MASHGVQCPICNRFFDCKKINTHVNLCLGVQDDTQPSRKNKDIQSRACLEEQPNSKRFKVDVDAAEKSPAQDGAMSSGKSNSWTFMMGKKSSTVSPGKVPPEHTKVVGKNVLNIPSNSLQCVNESPEVNNKIKSPGTSRLDLSTYINVPLAERMRPVCLDHYIGQEQAIGRKKLLRSLFEAHRIPSMILWGPPGCGKTTLARIIAEQCKESHNTRFAKLSATTSGVADVKEAIKKAKNELKMLKRSTILFIDEIHRFNKLQQDSFLPHVEDGTIILIGATTENPSFQVNNALMSRCKVITLEKLSTANIITILQRAIKSLGLNFQCETGETMAVDNDDRSLMAIEKDAVITLANYCDGDARAALNNLENVVKSKLSVTTDRDRQPAENKDTVVITVEDVKDGLLHSHLQYDRKGEEHFNCASALQKSIRGSDENGAIYWMTRMFEGGEDPLFIARRLVVIASEDIGLADNQALPLAASTFQACQFLGRPECSINLAHCVTYLARAPKSYESTRALLRAKECIHNNEGPQPSVPLHLRNASTKLMKDLGYGKGYKYIDTGPVKQEYLPEKLKGVDFYGENWK